MTTATQTDHPATGTGPAPAAQPDPLCGVLVKAAVYEGGLAAGVGLKAMDLKALRPRLKRPEDRQVLKALVVHRVSAALAEAGVTQGEDGQAIDEAVEAMLAKAAAGSRELVARKVAEGESPVPGEDGRLEYPLNPDNRAMHDIEGLAPRAARRWVRMVHQGEVLVQRVPPVAGRPGRGVRGEKLEPSKVPHDPSLASLHGTNTVLEENRILAECDGACEENAAGQVRVVPEVVVEAVNARTGSLPESGVSQAAILVRGDVAAGFRVASTEAVFIGTRNADARLEEGAQVTAGHLVVNGMALGQQKDGGEAEVGQIDVQGIGAVRQVNGASLVAARLLVLEDSRFGRLDADDAIVVGRDLVGGVTLCRRELSVGGDLGSAKGGSRTRVVVPREGGGSRRQKRLALAIHGQKKALAELQQKLEVLEGGAAKRAQASPFWAALLSGEQRQPRNPVEASSLRLYLDFSNEKKRLTRGIDEIRLSIRRLQDQGQEAQAEGAGGVTIRIGGHLHLDATVEATTEVDQTELEAEVSYTIEGKRFRNHTLQDLRTVLAKQAGEYLQGQSGRVEERRQAIEEMFKGTEARPSGPQVTHRRFTLPFTWSGQEEEPETPQLQVVTTAVVDTQDPHRLMIHTEVSARQALEQVELALVPSGARLQVTQTTGSGPVVWQDDAQLAEELGNVAFRGVSALAFLEGADPTEAGQTAPA